MTKALVAYVQTMNSVNTRLGKAVRYLVFVGIGILVVEGVSRYFFNIPTPWSLEMSKFVLGAYVALGGGYALLCESHVRMDAFYCRWSVKRRAIADAATFSIAIVYLITVLRGGIEDSIYAATSGQLSASEWGPPLYPIKIIMTSGVIIIVLATVALFLRDLLIIKGKSPE